MSLDKVINLRVDSMDWEDPCREQLIFRWEKGDSIRVARLIRLRLVFQLSRTRMSFCQPPSSRARIAGWRIYSSRHSWAVNASIRLIEAFNRYASPTASSSRTQMRAPSAGPLLFRPGRLPIRYSMRFAYLKFCFETSINNIEWIVWIEFKL